MPTLHNLPTLHKVHTRFLEVTRRGCGAPNLALILSRSADASLSWGPFCHEGGSRCCPFAPLGRQALVVMGAVIEGMPATEALPARVTVAVMRAIEARFCPFAPNA